MMRLSLAVGALAFSCSTLAIAQTQTAPAVVPQSPAKAKTTTTQSTTSTAVVPDQAGGVAAQRTTDTTQTTTTQPANGTPQSTTSQTTSTMTVKPDEPGTPATTTTTTTQPATDQSGATVTTATAADVKAGVPVFDSKGGVVGKVESVSAKGAVVTTGKAKAVIPVSSFGKNDKGLVMSMTKAELEAASAKAAPPPKTTKKPK
jgi:hypothetical protein